MPTPELGFLRIAFHSGVGIYFSLDSKTRAYGVLRAPFALKLLHKRSKCRPLLSLNTDPWKYHSVQCRGRVSWFRGFYHVFIRGTEERK